MTVCAEAFQEHIDRHRAACDISSLQDRHGADETYMYIMIR